MNRARSALPLAVLFIAAAPPVAAQPSPGFLCGAVAADSFGGAIFDYQRSDPQAQTTPVTLDVLFVISAAFGSAHRIDITTREVNKGFADSKTGITLRHVGPRGLGSPPGFHVAPASLRNLLAEIERPEHSVEERFRYMHDLLQRLPSDPSVQRWRSDAKADLVVVLASQGDRFLGQGTAFQPGPFGFGRSTGFVVMSDNLRLESRKHLLMHEIGHTLGLAHQPGERGWSAPYLPHGQGYASNSGNLGTVMSQGTLVWLDVFSFDGVSEKWGQRVGDRNHRAADAASVGAQFVADYEQASAPPPDPEPEPDPESDHSRTRAHFLGGSYSADVTLEDGRQARVVDAKLPGDQSAVFYFFDPTNSEMLVKVLDGCAINGYRWVFVAAATDQGFHLQVNENRTGQARVYVHESGTLAPALGDLQAFPCR